MYVIISICILAVLSVCVGRALHVATWEWHLGFMALTAQDLEVAECLCEE